MTIVGLTGGVATGKTTVANILKGLGASVIDADDLAKKVVEPGEDAYYKIVETFGREFVGKDRKLLRKKISMVVFRNLEKKKILEGIIHPKVAERMMKAIEIEREKNTQHLVLDIPLLFEKGMQSWIRPVILVYADREKQIKRLIKREKLSREDAIRMIDSQMPIEEKKKLADFVIDNNADLNKTIKQVKIIWMELLKNKR